MRFTDRTRMKIYRYVLGYSALLFCVCFLRRCLLQNDTRSKAVRFSKIIKDDLKRLELAKSIFDEFEKGGEELRHRFRSDPDTTVKYGVMVVSSDRSNKIPALNVQYVTETVSALIEEGSKLAPGNIAIVICNVDGNNQRRDLSRISQFFQVFHLDNYDGTRQSENVEYFLKQTSDYAKCLENLSRTTKAQYYLVLEDDAYLKKDFFIKLDHIMDYKISIGVERGEPVDRSVDMGQVKFYVPLLISRYHTDMESLLEILSISSVITGLSVLVHYIIHRRQIGLLFPASVFIFTFVCVVDTGRNNIQFYSNMYDKEPETGEGYSIIKPPRCCMAAALYSRRVLPELIDFLSTTHEFEPVDIVISKYFERHNLRQFLIYPHLIRHIGYVSSNTGKNTMRWNNWPKKKRLTVLPWSS